MYERFLNKPFSSLVRWQRHVHVNIILFTHRTVIAPMIEVFGGKAAYSNFWGGMDEEVSARECMIDL